MRMQTAQTQWGVIPAPATLAILEMESTVQVSQPHCITCIYNKQLNYCHAFNIADINECELERDPCHFNASCTDTEGSFNCTCREGFEGNGFNCTGIICIPCKHFYILMMILFRVADIPECERGLDNCDPDATCSNTFGSYECFCNTGFTGDGFTCTGQQSH